MKVQIGNKQFEINEYGMNLLPILSEIYKTAKDDALGEYIDNGSGIAFEKGRESAFKEIDEMMVKVWKDYCADKANYPRPDFMTAYAIVCVLGKEQGNGINEK